MQLLVLNFSLNQNYHLFISFEVKDEPDTLFTGFMRFTHLNIIVNIHNINPRG